MKRYFNYMLLISVIILSGCERLTESDVDDDGLPPAVPVGLHVYFAGDGEAIIEWKNNVEPDLKGYNIYRSIDSVNFSSLSFTPQGYYIDDSLDYNTKYFYRVSAVDNRNRESLQSNAVAVIPGNKYVPAKPRYLTINARNWEDTLSVFLSWQPNEETDIAGYEIFRGTQPDFTADTANPAGFSTVPSYTDTRELNLSRTYYYKIRAVDKGGLKSGISGEISDVVLPQAELLFPSADEETGYFAQFQIKTIDVPAGYKIVVQSNRYYGEVWSREFSSNQTNDTLAIDFTASYIEPDTYYYWRVITYTQGADKPNSMTKLNRFIIRQ